MIKLISSTDNWDWGCINNDVLWGAPSAKHFRGFSLNKSSGFFKSEKKKYSREDIARVVSINEDNSKSVIGTAGATLAGGLLLGGVGIIAGALAGGKKKILRIGVEFKDGKKIVFEEKAKDQSFITFIKYAEEMQATDTLNF